MHSTLLIFHSSYVRKKFRCNGAAAVSFVMTVLAILTYECDAITYRIVFIGNRMRKRTGLERNVSLELLRL